jgi:hypothetical protein
VCKPVERREINIKGKYCLFFLFLTSVVIAGIVSSIYFISNQNSNKKLLVGAYYYVWYSSSGRHWNDEICNTVRLHPILGQYDSRNSTIHKQHIEWAKYHGINFFAISWWGKNSFENKATLSFIQTLNNIGNPIKFCILAEKNLDLDYIYNTYAQNPAYQKLNDKPLIIIWERRLGRGWSDSRFTILYFGDVPYVLPGFDDRHLGRTKTLFIPRNNGETYKEQWKFVLEEKPNLVMINSFNEFHEETAIEPCKEWGTLYLNLTSDIVYSINGE